jgi:hypothetical protein
MLRRMCYALLTIAHVISAHTSLVCRGNTLYIYGGVTELGDTSIPLDDCW